MSDIFVSYRREDDPYAVQLIVERLKSEFGSEAVFFDQDTIDCGDDYIVRIYEALFTCRVVLVVIGSRWLDAKYEEGPKAGTRRIDDPDDLVRREIEIALRRQVVIPVLVHDTLMPTRDQLPSKLSKLSDRNAVEVRTGKDFEDDMTRLTRIIRKKLPSRRRPRLLVAAISFACLLVGMMVGWFAGQTTLAPPPARSNGETRSMVENVRGWKPAEVQDRLKGLLELAKDHWAAGGVAIAQAEKLNQELVWLPIKLDLIRNDDDFPTELRQQMEQALGKVARIVHRATDDAKSALIGRPVSGDTYRQRLAVLEAYLAGIKDLGDLKQAAKPLVDAKRTYWLLHRRYVLKGLADVAGEAASTKPADVLGTYVLELRYLAQFTRHCKVEGTGTDKEDLLSSLNEALTFCEARRAAGTYKATPKISLMLTSSELIDGNWRAISLETPEVGPIRLGFNPPAGKKAPIKLTRVKKDAEKTLGLGRVKIGIMSGAKDKEGQWEWKVVHTFPADLPGVPEKLSPLGMLLVEKKGQSLRQTLEHEGHKVEVQFTGLPVAPKLLWAASMWK